jgi:poly(A) polymerase
MPIIIPTYPAMNSAFSVSLSTREAMLEEFNQAENICRAILTTHAHNPSNWSLLLETYPFFENFKHFLKVEVSAANFDELKKWDGYIHSRLKNLTNEIQQYVKVRPWPQSFSTVTDEGKTQVTHYLGIAKRDETFSVPLLRKHSRFKRINLSEPVERFKSFINHNIMRKKGMRLQIQTPHQQDLLQASGLSLKATSSLSWFTSTSCYQSWFLTYRK